MKDLVQHQKECEQYLIVDREPTDILSRRFTKSDFLGKSLLGLGFAGVAGGEGKGEAKELEA